MSSWDSSDLRELKIQEIVGTDKKQPKISSFEIFILQRKRTTKSRAYKAKSVTFGNNLKIYKIMKRGIPNGSCKVLLGKKKHNEDLKTNRSTF